MSSPRVSLPLRVVSAILAVVVILLAWGETVRADFTPTLHKTLQAVNATGASLNPPNTPISLTGVVSNNPWDMLDYTDSALRPQWQVFIQATEEAKNGSFGDFGGTALYMGRFGPPFNNPTEIYSASDWKKEMDRLNYPNDANQVLPSLRRGDVIRVDAKAPGAFYNGKFNINEKHSNNLANDFNITILERGAALTAASISLADVKDASNNFIFDQTRLIGAEHYQGSLVHLDNLMLVDTQANLANWTLNGTVQVKQDNLTMDLKLGLDPNLVSFRPTAETKFSITAIFDQESADWKSGYRLWLTNAGDFSVVPEPSTVVLVLLGGALMVPVVRKRGQRIVQN
jgi:hypothetical protein